MYSRTSALIGNESMDKLKNAKVLICGLGGVGGYVCEALARAGVGTLGLCDFDTIDISNINRQVIALHSNVGMYKVAAWRKRIRDINPECKKLIYPFRLSQENCIDFSQYDYVADCIDDVPAKIMMIKKCRELGVPIISSMGTGNKMDPSLFKIEDIKKTTVDPLARAMRKKLKEVGIDSGVDVLYSTEQSYAQVVDGVIPSISFVPSVAGLLIAGFIVKNLIKEDKIDFDEDFFGKLL